MASYLISSFRDLAECGYYEGLAYWLNLWLIFVCLGISSYHVFLTVSRQQADEKLLKSKNLFLEKSCRAVEEKMQETAALRHEWKNQLSLQTQD